MRQPIRFVLLVASALTLWHTRPAQAWPYSNSSSPATNEPTGTQVIDISVGCASTISYPADATTDPTLPLLSYVVENPLAEFISLHFTQLNLPPTDYIIVRPTDAHSTSESIKYAGKRRKDFFSKALYTTSVTVELYSNGSAIPTIASPCVGFAIDQYRFLAESASYEASAQEQLCGADDSGEAACFKSYPEAFERATTVARLLIHKDGSSFFCTGWLVGCEGHLLTNHHCISNADHAAKTEFEFMAQGETCADKCDKPFGCEGKKPTLTSTLVIANEQLDYALVKIQGDLWKEYGYLQMREGGAKMDERVYIPQHPAGWGKRIAMKAGDDWGKVVSLNRGGCLPEQVAYDLDTQGGSSGSPVLSWNDNAVVAIHHCGGCPNTAVNIDKIIKDLRAKDLLPKCALYEPQDKPHHKANKKLQV